MTESLVAYARHAFVLSQCDSDGRSRRELLERFSERTGRLHPDLEPPEVDDDALYLWRWYCELAEGRQQAMGGANPLGWAEMSAWQQITGHEVEPWEADVLRAIDRAYLAHVAERHRAEAPTFKGKGK